MRMVRLFVAQIVLLAAFGAGASIEVAQDRTDALYRTGEEAVFTVAVKDGSGTLIKSGTADWVLDNFGKVRIGAGKPISQPAIRLRSRGR